MTAEPRFRDCCTQCDATLSGFNPFCPSCGGMTDVAYDHPNIRLYESTNPYVRFRELLPIADPSRLPADAVFTDTVHALKLGATVGMPWLYLKNEATLPTGTTKDRMAEISIGYLYEHGVRTFCTSSTGNSSTAYARAIVRYPEMRMFLFTGSHWAERVQVPAGDQVVQFVLRGATFVEAFDAARAFAERNGFVSERGFFNPGRREGLKMAWLEAVEQVPRPSDWYVQACSSAMGVYGVYGAARSLHRMGLCDRLPRVLCVQQETCAPMVKAWTEGSPTIKPEHVVHNPTGIAAAILRGNPTAAYPPIRKIVLESRGSMTAVSEREIREARTLVEDLEGLNPCFSASAAVAGLLQSVKAGIVPKDDTVVVNLTGSDRNEVAGLKRIEHYLERSSDGWTPADPRDEVASQLIRSPLR